MSLLRVPPEMFRFTTGDRAGLYVALMHVFAAAGERLETALGVDDVAARLRGVGWAGAVDDDQLPGALRQLCEWELLQAGQNHTEDYRTAAEYERRNVQYALTRRGEAAVAGVDHAMSVLAATGALQTAVLDAIADRLAELGELLTDGAGPDRRIFTRLMELEGHLDALRSNTMQFNGELQRLLRAEGADLDTFREVKTATVGYLQEFLTDLDHRVQAITAGIDRIEGLGVARLHHRALRGAELPPLAGGDPAPAWLAHRRARWDGLRAWFSPVDGSQPRAEQLHQVARRAIIALLQALDRITESRRRSSSAVADFRELARWFALAPTEASLHRLWATAFGLTPARHAHLTHPDPELIAPSATWREAAPVEVSPLLRSAARTERFSRTGRVRDVAALRAERTRRAVAERAELEAAWRLLDTGGPVRLSSIGRLDRGTFQRLLEILGRALGASPDPTGTRRGTTSDGKVELVLRPPAHGHPARLWTPGGEFSGPDYEIDIVGTARANGSPLVGSPPARAGTA
jgi:uncharacterized protein (TIGR02677 family)